MVRVQRAKPEREKQVNASQMRFRLLSVSSLLFFLHRTMQLVCEYTFPTCAFFFFEEETVNKHLLRLYYIQSLQRDTKVYETHSQSV